jgi:probable phosphoglycerate mutase
MSRAFIISADGGSRGNPGPAAYGAVVSENGKILHELFETIGVATNNVAEYNGLLAALRKVNEIDPTATVEARMDS